MLKKFKKILKNRKIVEEQKILISKNGDSSVDESYIRLKDNILFRGETGLKVVQISSSVLGEGKSTRACNLAVSIAFSGKKVVILDLDFKRPKVTKIFGVKDGLGVGDYLESDYLVEDVIQKTQYGVDVIGKGETTYNSSFLLGSDKFKDFIQKLREKYDFILLDCSPVMLSSDYIHLAKVSDGILLAVSTNYVKKTAVRETVKLLNKIPTPIIGCVMTMKMPNSSTKYDDEEI